MNKVEIDALRFEIIRRLAPGFRHRLSGKLHPVTLLSQLMSKKLEKSPTDTDFFLNKIQEIKVFTKQVNDTFSDLFTWINPTDTPLLPVNEIVADCLDLLKMDIHSSNVTFQNGIISNELTNAYPVRNVFCACILTLIDTTPHSSHILISEQTNGVNPGIVMTITPQIGNPKKEIVEKSLFDNWEMINQLSDTVKCEITKDQIVISITG